MIPNRLGLHEPQPLPPIHDGQDATPSPTHQGPSPSREKPRTLDDLPAHRNVLLRSKNPAAKILGEALASVHEQFKNRKISAEDHLTQCYAIREAAEMLNGTLDVEADVMQRLHLGEMTPEKNGLTNREHLILNDDLSVQLDAERGIAAVNLRESQGARSAERGRGHLHNMMRPHAENNGLHFGRTVALQAAPQAVFFPIGDRERATMLRELDEAVANGAAQRQNLTATRVDGRTSDADVAAAMRDAAEEFLSMDPSWGLQNMAITSADSRIGLSDVEAAMRRAAQAEPLSTEPGRANMQNMATTNADGRISLSDVEAAMRQAAQER
jgi:hypothetical protein